jgi:predicted nucleotide-binding protein (sugar kinase/HSP70/actin superfamily)
MEHKITIPHAGDYAIAFEYFFKKLGYDTIMPPKTSKETLDLGVKYSPNQACFPFKVTIGNLFEALDNGANVVAMIGGRTGICRLAYIQEMYRKVLTDHGYTFKLFPFKLKKEMWDIAKEHLPNLTLPHFLLSCYSFWKKLRLVEILREQCLLNRAYEKQKGSCSNLYNQFREKIIKANTLKEMRIVKKEIIKSFKNMPKDKNRKVIKIGVVGEFFLLIDQFSSLNIETMLGELGVVLEFSENFSSFFIGSVKQIRFLDKFFPTIRNKTNKLAEPFINCAIGGHALQTIGHSIHYIEEGFDGIILVYPFTCMPEITANAIMPRVIKEYNKPFLSVCFDEQTGSAGLQTRLEAFVDMISRKKYSAYN